MIRNLKKLLAISIASTLATFSANAAENLTAHTASAGGVPHLTIMHLADVLGEAGIANLQVMEGQTLTNSIVNLAEGKIDISAMPIVLTFLLDKGRGPLAKHGEKGAEMAANLRALYPYNAGGFGLFALDSENIKS